MKDLNREMQGTKCPTMEQGQKQWHFSEEREHPLTDSANEKIPSQGDHLEHHPRIFRPLYRPPFHLP